MESGYTTIGISSIRSYTFLGGKLQAIPGVPFINMV